MSIFDVLALVCGLALFLFGMNLMEDSLKRSAGNKLKTILGSLTSTPLRGFLLGLGVTAVIQSSSATTVMVVGFVNAGTMTLSQSVGVIMGANVGTAVTSWLISLSGLGIGESASTVLSLLKTSTWVPVVALVGIIMLMFSKSSRKRDFGTILLGFAVLMVGMEYMSESVSVLKTNEDFKNILTAFNNPLLGVVAGTVVTAVIQSSSASVGILQSLTMTGSITYGMAIPIVMGQNIGTCITALISAASANKKGKRAAIIHLYFNIIGVVIWLSLFYIFNSIFKFAFVNTAIGMWGVALVHTVFKLLSVIAIAPFSKQLIRLAELTVPDKGDSDKSNILDERLIQTPAIAIANSETVTRKMARISCEAFSESLDLLSSYDAQKAQNIRDYEEKADVYEDELGSYLVKVSSMRMADSDSRNVAKLLHVLGDFERISDHAVNIVESAEEISDKKIVFSDDAEREISVLCNAVREILSLAEKAYDDTDVHLASKVEPLEQVVDYLRDEIKKRHIQRLQNSKCSIEHGFVLSDILTNLERVSDHCSNIAGLVIEMSKQEFDMHEYLDNIKQNDKQFKEDYHSYMEKYSLD